MEQLSVDEENETKWEDSGLVYAYGTNTKMMEEMMRTTETRAMTED